MKYNPRHRAAAAAARKHMWFCTPPCEADMDDAGGTRSLEAAWIRAAVQERKAARGGSRKAPIERPGLFA